MRLDWTKVWTCMIGSLLAATAMAQKDPGAVGLLADAARSSGGVATLSAAGYLTPLDSLQQIPVAVRLKARAPGIVRWETAGPEGAVVTVSTGAWGWTGVGGAWRGLSASEAALRGAVWFPLLALEEWKSSPAFRLERPTTANEGGRTVQIVSVLPDIRSDDPGAADALAAIGLVGVVIDPARGLTVGVRLEDRSASDWRLALPLRMVFSDFRRVEGVWVPFEVTQSSGTTAVWRLRLDWVRINVPLDESEFWPEDF